MKNKQHHAGVRGGTTAYLFQCLLFLVFKPTRSDDDVQTEIFATAFFSTSLTLFPANRAPESWVQIAFVTESSPKERSDAFDVTIEVPLS